MKLFKYRSRYRRRRHGNSMIELPLALWIILVCLALPLIMLATMAIRYGFFWNAAREAAQNAAKCQTFLVDDASAGMISSVNTARFWAVRSAQSFTGITLGPIPGNGCQVFILWTDVGGTTGNQPADTPLGAAADPTNFVYTIQVQLTGSFDPLLPMPGGIFGFGVPGLTAPAPVMVLSTAGSEVPQGLNK